MLKLIYNVSETRHLTTCQHVKTLCDAVAGFRKRIRVRPLYFPYVCDVHVPAVSESYRLLCVTRSCFREKKKQKKTEKENFTEMAEGAATLKGLRAQMGKKM